MHDGPAIGERLWRVRKQSVSIDAQLHASSEGTDFELRFFYDGGLVLARRWPDRTQALAHANERLKDLQRAGWNTHW
jgi:hypothetical protein